METVPFIWPAVGEALVLLLVVAVTALLITIHRRNLLALLVEKQGKLIDKLRADASADATSNDRAFYHINDTTKWIKTRYRQAYGADTQLPETLTEEADQRRLEMMLAIQTLSQEIKAYREELQPDQTWAEIQPRLNKVLEPAYRQPAEIEVVKEVAVAEESAEDDKAPNEALETERARADVAEEALAKAEAEHRTLLDEIADQVNGPKGSPELGEWLMTRRAGLGVKAQDSEQREREDLMHKALSDALQKREAEMKGLRNSLASQHEMVARLQYKLTQDGGADNIDSADIEALNRMIKESETCIKTLELDLEETHTYTQSLEQKVATLEKAVKAAEASRPTKELEDTIQTLEDAAEEHHQQMEKLRKELDDQKDINHILRDQLGMPNEPVGENGDDDEAAVADLAPENEVEGTDSEQPKERNR